MSLRLTFCTGAGKVTGSNFLVNDGESQLLIDCGIEQGGEEAFMNAYAPFPYNVSEVDALVVTHAHLDHIGRIPKLVKGGFKGKIYMTPPTRDLALLILLDSVNLLREEATKRGLEPLYTVEDVETAFSLVETLEYHVEKEIAPGLTVFLRNTGHILGSASVRITAKDGTSVAFSGDIGNSPSPLLPDWEPVLDADAVLMESTYGNRLHPPHQERVRELRDALSRAIKRGGPILIPAFALERTQLMLYELSNFFSARELPEVPVFLDSPLAIKITEVYEKWGSQYFKPETEEEMRKEGSIFTFPFLTLTRSHDDSVHIAHAPNPKIIIAGAGMSHGGRIGGWEERYLSDPSATLCMVGYQAPGTPGRRIVEGASSVKLNGHEIKIKAHIEKLDGWSAHADRDQLLAFAEAALEGKHTKTIFVALGEPSSERFLAQRIHDYLGGRAIVPEQGQTWEVTQESVRQLKLEKRDSKN